MGDTEMWNDMLGVLKDISAYLAKEDASQETVKLAETPKTGKDQKEISGGADPSGKPGEGFTNKEFVPEKEDEDEDEEEDEKEDKKEDDQELKSLLKDIRSALIAKSEVNIDPSMVQKMISDEIKKSLPKESERLLRKMGFSPTRSDVVKIGADTGMTADIKKSMDTPASTATTEDPTQKATQEYVKAVTDMSKMSWEDLAAMRDREGHFRPF